MAEADGTVRYAAAESRENALESFAKAIDRLIGYGYERADCWLMTPRQIAGYLRIAHRRNNIDLAQGLNLDAIAARADGKDIRQTVKDLLKAR